MYNTCKRLQCSLILRKISKYGAIRCQILRPNAPNSLSAEVPPQTALRELTALPQNPQLHLREGTTSKGRTGREREGKGEGKER